jgi:hypothetical protein
MEMVDIVTLLFLLAVIAMSVAASMLSGVTMSLLLRRDGKDGR